MSVYCGACGTSNTVKNSFCKVCGEKLFIQTSQQQIPEKDKNLDKSLVKPSQSNVPPTQYSQPQSQQPQAQHPQPNYYPEGGYQPQLYVPLPEIRSYFYWFMLSIITFGIANYFYQYKIMQDLEGLENHTQHNYSAWPQATTRIDPGMMLIWLFLFQPVFSYKKYDTLHQHLKITHSQYNNLPLSGQGIIIFMIVSFALIFITFGISIFFSIGFAIYFEYKWQEALNAHINNHGIVPVGY